MKIIRLIHYRRKILKEIKEIEKEIDKIDLDKAEYMAQYKSRYLSGQPVNFVIECIQSCNREIVLLNNSIKVLENRLDCKL